MTLNHNRQRVTLWATHLGLGIHERHQQINTLLEVIDSADADVSILLGDFNEWFPWGRPLRASTDGLQRHNPLQLSHLEDPFLNWTEFGFGL